MSSIQELENAYDTAVVAVLNAIPGIQPEQAEHMVEAIVDLVLATFQDQLTEELQNESTSSH
jgi:Holliday junction resolvasome RuvABC DNA-binding subunit